MFIVSKSDIRKAAKASNFWEKALRLLPDYGKYDVEF